LSRRKKKIKKKKKEDEEKGKAGSFEVHVKADCKRACVEEPEAKAKPCSLLRLILMSLELLSLSLSFVRTTRFTLPLSFCDVGGGGR
jgi:hypothetical protein